MKNKYLSGNAEPDRMAWLRGWLAALNTVGNRMPGLAARGGKGQRSRACSKSREQERDKAKTSEKAECTRGT
jgi:hypothetical protein